MSHQKSCLRYSLDSMLPFADSMQTKPRAIRVIQPVSPVRRTIIGIWSAMLFVAVTSISNGATVVDNRPETPPAGPNGNADGLTVNAETAPDKIEFGRHVLPVLSKLGCNSGACHGAQAGKGGFRLSLHGYDPVGDHFNITKQARGRRVELADPARSLLLIKPTGVVAHQGGLKLDPESKDYHLLVQWIARGAQGPTKRDARLERVEVLPTTLTREPGQSVELSVWAHYSDGVRENVTPWAKYSSTNEPVAQVDDQGTATVVGRGEASIVVWFSSQIALANIQVPFDNQVDQQVFDSSPRSSYIDDLVLEKLNQLKLKPSPRADDYTFVRRVFLDTIGVLPNAEKVESFVGDSDANKRAKLIDELLAREEFVDYWTYKWSDLFLINGRRLRPAAVKAYYQWLRKRVQQNQPWDQLVREVVTAQGSSYEQGQTNFYALHQTPEEMAENVSQAFLGLSIGCAKCHNHPLEKWTNDQYYAMANLFSRVRAKGWGGDGRNGNGLRTLFLANSGELTQPLTGKPQPPTPLDGEPLAFDDPRDRRAHLADWLVAANNPYFSRSIVNRVWASFMGRGLVEQVDDMRISNPATNEALLSAMSKDLIQHDFDLRHLMRQILNSETYQRSSQPIAGNHQDDRFYARYYPRRLMAEVLLDAVSQVTQVPTEFSEIAFKGADSQKTKEYPRGTRAIELYDSAVRSDFLKTFGRNNRDIVCECERSNQPSMVQVLHLSNGSTINEKLRHPESAVSKMFAADKAERFDPAGVTRQAYLTTLSRLPSDEEQATISTLLQEVPIENRREAVEDLYWSLMSSREFLFQH